MAVLSVTFENMTEIQYADLMSSCTFHVNPIAGADKSVGCYGRLSLPCMLGSWSDVVSPGLYHIAIAAVYV